MKRQSFLPTLSEHEYLLLSESVGWYRDDPENEVDRKKGSLNNFSIHLIVDGKGFVESDVEVHMLQRCDAFLYPNDLHHSDEIPQALLAGITVVYW